MEIVSYVIPIYKDGEAIGVVGMDLDFGSIKNLVANTHVYESGYGFLTDENGKVIYHSQLPMNTPLGSVDTSLQPIGAELKKKSSGETLFSYSWRGEEKKMAFRALRNGMRMVLTVPETEINALKDDLVFQISTALLLISFISVILTIVLTKRMIRPLKELTVAAKKIADGNLDVFIKHHAKDEVGTLADSFEQTATHLKKYIDDINRLAYQDILTGVRNKTAYFEVVKRLEEKIAEEKIRLGYPKFAVVMFDINGLKEVNDTLGHDFGDLLIRDACKIISDVFKQNQVYRIGGDEFVIILEQKDYEQYPELSERFKEAIDAFNRQDRQTVAVSIASGIAYYDKAVDNTFGDVFKRADSAMYKNKA
ncbi:MAG: diguanylate cyclase, partial [Eubacterium sp.]